MTADFYAESLKSDQKTTHYIYALNPYLNIAYTLTEAYKTNRVKAFTLIAFIESKNNKDMTKIDYL